MPKSDFKRSALSFLRTSSNRRSSASSEEEHGSVTFLPSGPWNKSGMEEKDWKWNWTFPNDLFFFFAPSSLVRLRRFCAYWTLWYSKNSQGLPQVMAVCKSYRATYLYKLPASVVLFRFLMYLMMYLWCISLWSDILIWPSGTIIYSSVAVSRPDEVSSRNHLQKPYFFCVVIPILIDIPHNENLGL